MGYRGLQTPMLRSVLLAAIVAVSVAIPLGGSSAQPRHHEEHGEGCMARFHAFRKEHGKRYASPKEETHRLATFCSSLKEIDAINARAGSTWKAGVNHLSDMTAEEFMSAYTMPKKPQECSATGPPVSSFVNLGPTPAPEKDWRNATCGETSCVSGVKNQGKCGSCWTFSTVGAMESVHAINTGMMELYSEQQLLDCAGDFANNGCNGGLPSQAFEYIHYAGGLVEMEDYPYVCGDGSCTTNGSFCKINDDTTPSVKVKAVVNFTEGDEKTMMKVVGLQNPVSVAFDVVSDLRHYASGVYQSTVCNKTDDSVNHAVLAVGYGAADEDGTPYWTIKNSWSEAWGNRGYFKILRGSNMCGIATCASFPILEVVDGAGKKTGMKHWKKRG